MATGAFLRHHRGRAPLRAIGWGQSGDWKFLTLSTDSQGSGEAVWAEITLSFFTRAQSVSCALLKRMMF